MKTKPLLITIACIAMSVCAFFYVKAKYFTKPDKGAIILFLSDLDIKLRSGNTDSALTCFDIPGAGKKLVTLIETLNGTTTMMGIKVNADVRASKLNFINPELVTAVVPVTFLRDSIPEKNSTITFTIRKIDNLYKITTIKAGIFVTDYVAYQNLVRSKTVPPSEIYSAITLAAFKTADSLKALYDSVVWFDHIHQKTYYYVVKGAWDMDDFLQKDTIRPYQMGLLGPDLKEIIPPKYDLIHNIGATFAGLIEVDKDHKHGFYNLNGKIVLPVQYDEIFPVKDGANMAALRMGTDYYWLKNDTTVSGKVDLKISDIIADLKKTGSNIYKDNGTDDIMEFNSHELHSSVYIPPSYLADLNILPVIKTFENPLRKNVYFEDASSKYIVSLNKNENTQSGWLASIFYSIRDYYLGGRAEFYDTHNIVLVDKKSNRFYSYQVNTDISEDEDDVDTSICSDYNIRPLSDSLFEVKISTVTGIGLYNDDILESAPVYHYLVLKDDKLVEMPTNRVFSFTKFRKMDDSYLSGCFQYAIKPVTGDKYREVQLAQANQEILKYMKNEIFADYNYAFKDTVWTNVFKYRFENYKPVNTSVDDSLTAIDKFNIGFINQKLQQLQNRKLALR